VFCAGDRRSENVTSSRSSVSESSWRGGLEVLFKALAWLEEINAGFPLTFDWPAERRAGRLPRVWTRGTRYTAGLNIRKIPSWNIGRKAAEDQLALGGSVWGGKRGQDVGDGAFAAPRSALPPKGMTQTVNPSWSSLDRWVCPQRRFEDRNLVSLEIEDGSSYSPSF